MFDPSLFTTSDPRYLPVFLLIDQSGSMGEIINPEETVSTGQTFFDDGIEWEIVEGGTSRADILNQSLERLIRSFARLEKMDFGIKVAIITFSNEATMSQSLEFASNVQFNPIVPNGHTAMGGALSLASDIINDRQQISSRSYRPVVVLVSDGRPTDHWDTALQAFKLGARTSKCQKLALAIGDEAGQALTEFVDSPDQVVKANRAEEITEFFKQVTMSVSSRSLSKNPNLDNRPS